MFAIERAQFGTIRRSAPRPQTLREPWRLSPVILGTVVGVLCVALGIVLARNERRQR